MRAAFLNLRADAASITRALGQIAEFIGSCAKIAEAIAALL